MKKLIIALSLDYGVKEYFWYSNFGNYYEVLKWWLSLKSSDIYKNKLEDIIGVDTVALVKDNEQWDIFYSCEVSVMMENDNCSYLLINGDRYEFLD